MGKLQIFLEPLKLLYNFESLESCSQEIKEKISFDILDCLMTNEKYAGEGLTNYLSSLNTKDIAPFNTLFEGLISGQNSVNNNGDIIDLLNAFSIVSINGIWKRIRNTYPKNEELDKIMAEKDGLFGETLYYSSKYNNNNIGEIINYFLPNSILDIQNDNFSKGYSAFISVLKFEEFLSADLGALQRRQSLKDMFGGNLDTFLKTMLNTLKVLYSTGFSGFPEEGILLNNGEENPLLYMSKKGEIGAKKQDKGTIRDYNINKSILEVYPNLKNIYNSNEDIVPSVTEFLEHKDSPFICFKLHLLLQTANLHYRNTKISVEKWVESTKKISLEEWREKYNGGKYIIQKWSDVEKWYKWVLETIFLDALMEYNQNGIQLQGKLSESDIVTNITNSLIVNLKNIVVVSERDNKKFSKTEIRFSYVKNIDYEVLKNCLSLKLNPSGANIVKFEKKGQGLSPDILILSILFDPTEANKGNLFAGDVIDKFIESGNMPSWSHALIGKKEDGSLFFWDGFMDPGKAGPQNRCYTIYAASRSGKGVMTSTLVASALCDGKQVFYTDGKPENGSTMGMVAWKDGKEAYVFDGKSAGSKPFEGVMEDYTNGLRSHNEVAKYLKELPTELFESSGFNTEEHLKFLGVMRYLKSLMLCAETIIARANGKLPMDNWQIWVFDEMTSMSRNEIDIRKLFARYCNNKNIGIISKIYNGETVLLGLQKNLNPDILNPLSGKYDEGIKYINDWCLWNSALVNKIKEANVISLGKANTNMIFIFQEPSWIKTDGNISTIGQIVKTLQSTKIVGRGGIVPESGDYGDATIKEDWVRKINIEGACNWAMSHGANIRKSEVTLFKPFNIWTVPLDEHGEMNKNPLPEEEAVRYFEGYTKKLLGSIGKEASDVIESAYIYADNAVKTLGLLQGENRENVRDYLYDCANLSIKDGVSLSDSYNKLNGVETDNVGKVSIGVVEDTELENDSAVQNGDIGEKVIGTDTKGSTIETTVEQTPFVNIEYDNDFIIRYNSLIEHFNPYYTKIINKIEQKKEKLKNIPAKEKNIPSFNNLKSEILRNFSGEYAIDKNKFLSSLKNEINDKDLELKVIQEYTNRFEEDYSRLQNEITNMEMILEQEKEGTEVVNENQTDPSILDSFAQTDASSVTTKIESEPIHSVNTSRSQTFGTDFTNETFKIFDIDKEDSVQNVSALSEVTNIVITDIKRQMGGINNITSLAITANGCLSVNGYVYIPHFPETFLNSMGQIQRQEVMNGNICMTVKIGQVLKELMINVFDLSIESQKIAYSDIVQNDLGVLKKGYSVLFKKCPNLQTISLPNQELTRDNPGEPVKKGIGAKLSSLFGFGRGKRENSQSGRYIPDPTPYSKDHSFIDRAFDSKPVRILTGAFGWTMGCKAVVLAATLFGPWGMLFGALAMAGTYKTLKEDRQNNSRPRSGGQQGFGGQRGGQSGQQYQQKKQKKGGKQGGRGSGGGYGRGGYNGGNDNW